MNKLIIPIIAMTSGCSYSEAFPTTIEDILLVAKTSGSSSCVYSYVKNPEKLRGTYKFCFIELKDTVNK